jgi:Uma2 family endonuclease
MNLMETTLIKSESKNTIAESKKMTYEEFLDWCDEDTWVEWVDGDIIMTSPASIQHQRIYSFLEKILSHYVALHNLGEVILPPFHIKLESSGREPDIMFVSTEHIDRIKNTYLEGSADMVVEIVSPESMRRDRADKFFEYESAGINEYWLIDPIRKQAEFYRLGTDKFYHLISPDSEDIYHSEIIKGFWLNVSWLWKEPLPPVSDAWQEINQV